ncbi:MAG: MarR family transcriptional regulator [Planctomycetes bacterium]|nr:MarR family transcriptional regulator [Planctomycetota bacterium]
MKTLREELKKKNPFDMPEQEAYLNIIYTQEKLFEEFTALFKPYGLTPPRYNVLTILRGVGSKGIKTLAILEPMINRITDLTRLVDKLVRERYAKRQISKKDRRVIYVKITAKGLDVLAKLDKPVLKLHKDQLGHLTRRELSELNRLLPKCRYPTG